MSYISYNTHHSAFGAYSSFIAGETGKGGGFAINDVKSPEANLYIGYRTGEGELYVLPFFNMESYNFGQQFGFEIKDDGQWTQSVHTIKESDIKRKLGFASDEWSSGLFKFKIFTPFTEVPGPESFNTENYKRCCVPAILAELTLDNTLGKSDATLFFGMDGLGRLLGDHSKEIVGGACCRTHGFAALKGDADEDIGFNSLKYIAKGGHANYRLGREVCLRKKIPAGEKGSLTLALGTYQDGFVTSGLDCSFAYTHHFKDLEDVLFFILKNRDHYINLSVARDKELERSSLNEWRQMLLSLAVHSYYASSELLMRENGELLWIVNEGEYRMMNTLDLTVDHLFFELKYHPWAVKNVMDFFYDKYSYTMPIKAPDGTTYEGGLSFCHDCGVANMFSKPETSAYEFMHEEGCFSFMTMEELLNWSICSSIYGICQGDKAWQNKIGDRLVSCLDSIIARDKNSDGIMDSDCTGCGAAYEITTYDSLDKSLSHAANNLYMAVKTFGAILCLEQAFRIIGDMENQIKCEAQAQLIAKTVCSFFMEAEGYFPAVLDGEDKSKVIPAIEGLIYPFYLGDREAVSTDGRFKELILKLIQHIETVLVPGACIVPESLGWRLSASSRNTWMSKIFLNQYICENILGFMKDEKMMAADMAHVKWQFKSCSSVCAIDQLNCEEELPIGSRLYPRLVTSILWMDTKEVGSNV